MLGRAKPMPTLLSPHIFAGCCLRDWQLVRRIWRYVTWPKQLTLAPFKLSQPPLRHEQTYKNWLNPLSCAREIT